MLKTIARMLYKSCPRCRGDLILDDSEHYEAGTFVYECLQCGRAVRIETRAERREPIAA